MAIRAFLHPQGTHVRVRRDLFPIDPRLVGRTGLVLELNEYRPRRYGVVLDGESEVRDFHEDELEPVGAEPDTPVEVEAAPAPA